MLFKLPLPLANNIEKSFNQSPLPQQQIVAAAVATCSFSAFAAAASRPPTTNENDDDDGDGDSTSAQTPAQISRRRMTPPLPLIVLEMLVEFCDNNAEGRKRSGGGFGRWPTLLLLLQFAWILPYLCYANYLERWLLPFRLYCYTEPNLLSAQMPLRSNPDACIQHFFGAHNLPDSKCTLNHTLPVLLGPDIEEIKHFQRVVVVRSAPRHGEYRSYIRSSWKDAVSKRIGPVFFVCGTDSVDLREESETHKDILQLAFDDSYQNLTRKMMGLYRFFIEQTAVKEIVVVNDDTIVNATALESILNEKPKAEHNRFLIGKVSRGYPRLIIPSLPWYVSAESYPHKCYPPFVQGSSFVISREAADEILAKICSFPHIHLDDVMMGIITNCLQIRNIHREGFDQHSLQSPSVVFHYQFERYTADHLQALFATVQHRL